MNTPGQLPAIFLIHPVGIGAIDHARGLRDASIFARCCEGTVTIGGQLNQGTRAEWELFGKLGHPRINLTHPPLPALLTYETFAETQLPTFHEEGCVMGALPSFFHWAGNSRVPGLPSFSHWAESNCVMVILPNFSHCTSHVEK